MVWAPWRAAPVPTPRRLLASIGADASLPSDAGASAILSPDGTTLAFVAQQANETRLFVRKLDQLQAAALAGTEGAASPFFSPDGQWIAFFAGGKLKKVSVTGGAVVTLCERQRPRRHVDRRRHDHLHAGKPIDTTLMRVSAAGGTPTGLRRARAGRDDDAAVAAGTPRRQRRAVHRASTHSDCDAANLVVAPLSGGRPKIVVRGGYYGRYVPTRAPGLHAAGHALRRALRSGSPRDDRPGRCRCVEGVLANPVYRRCAGGLVRGRHARVRAGAAATRANPIDWLTRDGKTSVLRAAKADWANPRFSPDGQKLALDISDGKQRDIWVYEWARDTLTQLTFDPARIEFPVWTPDGRRIVFASDRAKPGVINLYWVNADGTGDVTRLTDSSRNPGRLFVASKRQVPGVHAKRGATQLDLMILPMEGDAARGWTPGKPTVFLSTPANEVLPMFSPDGRWIAYVSNEAGGICRCVRASVPRARRQMARVHGRRRLSAVVGHLARTVVPATCPRR